MTYQVLARKWRPKTFDDMVGQSHILKALKNALEQDRVHHAYLFTGTRGVGKTTLARILAKCLNCEIGVSSKPCGKCSSCIAVDEGRFVDLIEVDAASRTKVDETRALLENVPFAPASGRYKVYLIDEIHMFSLSSFNALLKTLEEPPSHVKFLLATTTPKKVPITILSRCLQFNLSHLTSNQISNQIDKILSVEKVKYDKPSIELIARCADGSMRDALSLLDQAISYGDGVLKELEIRKLIGTTETEVLYSLIQSLINSDPEMLMNTVEKISLENPDYDILLTEMLSLLQKVAVVQILPEDSNNSLKSNQKLVGFANAMTKEEVQLYYQIAVMGRKDLYYSPDAKSGLEMLMIRMLAFNPTGVGEITKKKRVNETSIISSDNLEDKNIAKKEKKIAIDSINKPSDDSWEHLINEMNLVGVVNELARNCILKSLENDKIKLSLTPSSKHLLNQNMKARLEEAVIKKFGKNIKLIIAIEDSNDESPSEVAARLKKEQKSQAKEAVKNDPDVKSLLDTFDATIDKDSIQPQ